MAMCSRIASEARPNKLLHATRETRAREQRRWAKQERNVIPLKPTRTFLSKWILPYVGIALILGWQIRKETLKSQPEYLAMAFVSALCLVIFFFAMRRQYKGDPDAVLDGGTFLRVSFGSESEDIPISSVREVETGKLFRSTKIALVLKEKSRFGEVIEFYPYQKKIPSGENEVVNNLRRRLNVSL
jgi:hypothetical protein